jgi:hypothetical protein
MSPPLTILCLKDSSGVVNDKVFESLEISNAVSFCCSPLISTLCMKIQPLNAGMEGLLNKVFDGMFEPHCFRFLFIRGQPLTSNVVWFKDKDDI